VSDLIEAVEQTIIARQLLGRGQPVLLAVSGGLDSMVLLRVLHSLSRRNRWRLAVAHFNHRLRAEASDADERLVRATAEKLGLRFVGSAGDAAALARREKVSVEMAARRLRHDFLARTAKRLKIKTIALAHHADDQVELFFLRLLRGAGGEGLAGMKWNSPSPNDPGVRLVRPLLDRTKAALRRFAAEQGITFREDATNAQLHFLRNRIRNKLLPLLSQKYQPALARSVLRTMDLVSVEADFVRRAAEEWLERRRRSDFENLHPAVQRQIIRIQLMKMDVAPDFDLVEQLHGAAERAVSVGAGQTVCRERTGRIVKQPNIGAIFKPDLRTIELEGKDGAAELGGLNIHWQIVSGVISAKPKVKFSRSCEHFDADKVGSPIILRHWRRGDRFQPIGLKAPVKLQDLLVNRKIPHAQRHQLVVATTAAGELFWVEGLRMSERFKLDSRTVHRLKWRWSGR